MEDPIFNCVLQIGYFWVTLVVMIVLYSGIYKVALTLQRKSEAKQKKMTSLVSMAGQTMTKIGIGMSKQQSIDSAKLFKSSDDDKKEGGSGGGSGNKNAAVNAKPTANQLSVNTTTFNSKQNEGDKEDDRSSSPAFPSDTDHSSETAREKGITKSKGRGKKTKEKKQKESKVPGKLGKNKKNKKNSISNANCIDHKKGGDKLLQNSVQIPPPPTNTTVRSVNASRPSVTGNDLSGGLRRASQALSGRRPSSDGRRASQVGRRASVGRRKSKPEIDFNEFIYCGPVSVATNVNVNKAFEDDKGPKLVRSDTVASGEGDYTDDEDGEVDEDLLRNPDGDPIDPISFLHPPPDLSPCPELPDNQISPSTPNFPPPPPAYTDVINDLGKEEQNTKNSPELLFQVNAFSPGSDHGNNFCIGQANGASNRISPPCPNLQHHQQQQDLHVTNFMTSCQPGEYLAPTNADANATAGNVTTTHFPVNSFDEIATTTTTATNNLNSSPSSCCKPPDLGCGGGEFTQSPITNTNVFPNSNNCLTDSKMMIGQNGPPCDYNVSNSNTQTPINLGSPHSQVTNPFLPLENNQTQPMNFEHFNGQLSNSSSSHQQLQPNLASPLGSKGVPSPGTFETSPVGHQMPFEGVKDIGIDSQQRVNSPRAQASNRTALAITAPPELLSGVRYIDQDSVKSPLSTDNLQLLVEPIMPIYQEPDSPVWKRRSLVETQSRQMEGTNTSPDPTCGRDVPAKRNSNRAIKETCLNQPGATGDNSKRGANVNLPAGSKHSTSDCSKGSKSALNNGSLAKPPMDTLDPRMGGHNLLSTAPSSNSSGGASTSGMTQDNGNDASGMASVQVVQGAEGNGTTVTKLASADDIQPLAREDSSLEFRSGSLRGRKVKHKGFGESPLRGIVKSVSHRRSKRVRSKREKTTAEKQKSKSENRARKALRTITIILGAFLICWTPWHICSLILGFCPEGSVCMPGILYDISYWLCYLNSPINPFCYAFANQQFKKAFIRIIKFDWHRT